MNRARTSGPSITLALRGALVAAALLGPVLAFGQREAAAQPPTANDDDEMTFTNQETDIQVLANDMWFMSPPNPATVTIVSYPEHGSVSVDTQSGGVTYYPDEDYEGDDEFTYKFQDQAGVWSNVATVSLTVMFVNSAPIISNLGATHGLAGACTFHGQVDDDEAVEGLTITFGGFLAGRTCTVQADGSFSYSMVLGPNDWGMYSAVTTDLRGATSNTAQNFLLP